MEPESASEEKLVLPVVSCLCPTYRRPELLANSLACYLAQDYPSNLRELIILDDAGEFRSQDGEGWELISVKRRFRSLPEKYNALAGMARGDVLVVWEDDDVYLPWHISAHVTGLSETFRYSKPERVLCHIHGRLQEYSAAGRFHASIAFTRSALRDIHGWPMTLRSDFDQLFMGQLATLGPAADPLASAPCSYIFRGESTLAYHGQSFMRSHDDETWYDRAEQAIVSSRDISLNPMLDENTLACCSELGVQMPRLVSAG